MCALRSIEVMARRPEARGMRPARRPEEKPTAEHRTNAARRFCLFPILRIPSVKVRVTIQAMHPDSSITDVTSDAGPEPRCGAPRNPPACKPPGVHNNNTEQDRRGHGHRGSSTLAAGEKGIDWRRVRLLRLNRRSQDRHPTIMQTRRDHVLSMPVVTNSARTFANGLMSLLTLAASRAAI